MASRDTPANVGDSGVGSEVIMATELLGGPEPTVHTSAPSPVSPLASSPGGSNDGPSTPAKGVKVSSPSTSTLSTPLLVTEPASSPPSTDATPVRVVRRRRAAPAPKGILKAPSAPTSRFNFRRDILQPFNYRLASSGYGPPAGPSADTLKNLGAPAAAAAAAAGSFWGSAMKRLAVVANPTPAQRDLSEDAPPSASTSTTSPPVAAVTSSPQTSNSSPERNSHHASPSVSTANPSSSPHMPPARGLPTSGTVTSSPYATFRGSAPASSSTPPAPLPPTPLAVSDMKKVRFRMATLKVVYPINGPNGPLAPWEEGATRKRINTEYRALRQRSQDGGDSKGWTGEELGRLYAECCRTREEPGIERVRKAFRDNPKAPPKALDLSNELLSLGAVEALADVLSVDFGLKKLLLDSCGLDDESLKPLLHSLLVSGSLPTLSLAKNKRIRAKGWKLIAIFIRKARFLRYLDLSDTNVDKKAADYLVQALTPNSLPLPSLPPTDSVDETASVSAVDNAPSTSKADIKSALLMPSETSPEVEDIQTAPTPEQDETLYVDEIVDDDTSPLFTVAPLLRENAADTGTVLSLRLENCGLKAQALDVLAHGIRASALKHISIRRNRINALGAVSIAIMIRDYPVATDSSWTTASPALDSTISASPVPTASSRDMFEPGNSVTARQALQVPYARRPPAPAVADDRASTATSADATDDDLPLSPGSKPAAAQAEREAWLNSEARNKLRKQIDELPRTGSLLTLDVKGNDIRNGVTYIAQVLKRNRTLKVLNLSENKIDVQGLASVAEALKYNSTLETLDMSLNPCCGPGIEGVTALRAAITINSSLKRVFLNSTDLTSEGAIALAEFLPEAHTLIHLDLTANHEIDIAGAMALSVSVKMNTTIRCLDLNVPPNDPAFATLSQEILQCCVRNTEMAQERSIAQGQKVTIAAPILKSAVARDLKTRQEAEDRRSRHREAATKSNDEILTAAEECQAVLNELLVMDEEAAEKGVIVAPSEVVRDLLVQAQLAEAQLAEAVVATSSGDQKSRGISLGDQLTASLDRAKKLYDRQSAPSLNVDTHRAGAAENGTLHPPSPIIPAPSSPSFSITDSDEEANSDTETSTPSTSLSGLHISVPTLQEDRSFTVADSPKSPIESQSRSFTLEEGEVFRRGSALGAADVDEEDPDISGEELKKEILETDVERSPRPSFSGESNDHPAPSKQDA